MSEHCFFCGHALDADHACPSCGVVREAKDDKRVRAPCPRCHDVRLVPFALGSVGLQACPRCRGSFFAPADWDEVFEEYPSEAPAERSEGHNPYRGAPAPAEETNQTNVEPDVRCPTCGEVMDRLEFAGVSAIITDVCKLHGVWLDAGELDRIIALVRKREEPLPDLRRPIERAEPTPVPAWIEAEAIEVDPRPDPATVRLGRALGALQRWLRGRG